MNVRNVVPVLCLPEDRLVVPGSGPVDVASEVARRVRLGEDPTLLAAEFGVTLQTVRRWLAAAGLSEPRKPAPDPTSVVAAYAAGEPLRVITKRFGVDDKTVIKMVRRSDQPMRRPRLTREMREEILARRRSGEKAAELYRSGLTLEEVGQRFGMTAKPMRSRLISSGVKMRPRGTVPKNR